MGGPILWYAAAQSHSPVVGRTRLDAKNWTLRSSAEVKDTGAEISMPAYDTRT